MNLEKAQLIIPAVFALDLSAYSGGIIDSATTDEGASGATITTDGSGPQNPLIPADINETGGSKILDLIFAGLVYYDARGAVHNRMAEKIEPNEDFSVQAITLKKGQKFSDGTEVKARNFVEAWKKGVSGAMLSPFLFEPIQGADEEGASDLTGLEAVDDYTSTVTLRALTTDFSQCLGYSAFAPLPGFTLEDMKKGGKNPIGNDPYVVTENDWGYNVQIHFIPNPEHKGDNVAKNDGMDIIFYASQGAAYQDLPFSNLDVPDSIPDSAFTTFEADLLGHSVNQTAAIFQFLVVPRKFGHFPGKEGNLRHQAFSYATDRDTITETVSSGTRTPAKDFISPAVGGYNASVKGSEVLSYSPEKTKELWAKAGAISPWSDTFTIDYNSDGGHQAQVDTVINSIGSTLSIDAVGAPHPDFKSLRTEVTNHTIAGAFRAGRQAGYPGEYNFIAPPYGTGTGSNDTDYLSTEFDSLLRESTPVVSTKEPNRILDQAQEVLFKDLPAIPLWYANVAGGWSEKVDNVAFNWKSVPIYSQVTRKA